MNRRGFLKLLGIAPAVAPQIAQAASEAITARPLIQGALLQRQGIWIKPQTWLVQSESEHREILAPHSRSLFERMRDRIAAREDHMSVLDQMREHDLFDLSGVTA